ncbi:chorismate--pyruvate lyase family protein [Spirabiliibacterium falconis]|uniref:chorismate--pyruvate lyase family protein n=1 Tax=Spirabiliibacterium falconis TaxID=572023 RepID=UPI001AAD2A04|nr:chorismate lyase [Spirabiliibacterium falconis]MBE2895246.1 chorismate lyase [Spirabiliibacterium falconis]
MSNVFAHAQWQDNVGTVNAIPPAVRHWLCSSTSLTAMLKQKCGQFQVTVENEGWLTDLFLHETALLPRCERYWVREVTLLGDGMPWVFARTVIPASTSYAFPQLLTLDTTPLGEFLFQHNGVRGALQWSRIAHMYARRSCFHLGEQPLLVSELFLPEFNFNP